MISDFDTMSFMQMKCALCIVIRYADLMKCMDSISLEELIMAVRRQSQGFLRGTSSDRGVTHHPSGRWEARIGIPGSRHIYLGLFDNEREAARHYDRALVRLRGTAAASNFLLSDYREELAEYHQMQQVERHIQASDVHVHCATVPVMEYCQRESNSFSFIVDACCQSKQVSC